MALATRHLRCCTAQMASVKQVLVVSIYFGVEQLFDEQALAIGVQ